MEKLEQLSIFDLPTEPLLIEPPVTVNGITEKEEVPVSKEVLLLIEETPYIEEILPYEIGDTVRVDIDSLDESDVLNYNYLLDFLKKKGTVKRVIHKPTLQYEVRYGDTIAFMYHKDLTI